MKETKKVRPNGVASDLLEEELDLVNSAVTARMAHLRDAYKSVTAKASTKTRKVCPTKKRPFRDKKEADYVLHFIMNNRRESIETGGNYRFAQYRSYLCACGYFHHSSKPLIDAYEVANAA